MAQSEKQHAEQRDVMPGTAWAFSGLCFLPFILLLKIFGPQSELLFWLFTALVLVLAPLPALLVLRRRIREVTQRKTDAEERMAQFKLRLDEVRFRSARLREELQAADQAAKLTNQLAVLGQFTAGFMHEFNNPLAIVEGRIEVLLDERKEDAALHADLTEMLNETRYMARIAKTLLQALRRERGGEVYEPINPMRVMEDVADKMRGKAALQGARVQVAPSDLPQVDIPEHVLAEVLRGLVQNALNALNGRENSMVRISADEYQTAGAKVILNIDDNGPGVAAEIQSQLFEPFVTTGLSREHLGLGLFLAASLLDIYDAKISYYPSPLGGAGFRLELPRTRFTNSRQYHWFQGSSSE